MITHSMIWASLKCIFLKRCNMKKHASTWAHYSIGNSDLKQMCSFYAVTSYLYCTQFSGVGRGVGEIYLQPLDVSQSVKCQDLDLGNVIVPKRSKEDTIIFTRSVKIRGDVKRAPIGHSEN